MAVIRGCLLPEDLYYLVDRHVWVRPGAEGVARVGITPSGFKLAGGRPVAITLRTKAIGREIAVGRPVAVMESSKWAGGIPAPFTGTLLRGNELVVDNPQLAVDDPYGNGWIVEMRPSDWEAARASLLTGEDAINAFRALLEKSDIECG